MVDLQNITHVYFIGIGGIGMSALARYFHTQGRVVQGYDRTGSVLIDQLVSEGIVVQYDDEFDAVPSVFKNPDHVIAVYTPAVSQDADLLLRFRESEIPLLKRAQVLGEITKNTTCLAIAGTHGKTTTSSILAHLLYASGVKMTAFLGGIVEEYNTNFLHSGTDVVVVEADEFDRSFLHLSPDFAGITAVDADHLDIYGSADAFLETFHEFAALVPEGHLFVHDDLPLAGTRVGLDGGAYRVKQYVVVDGLYHFDLITPQGTVPGFCLKLPGRHNLFNALLALTIALEYGIAPELLKKALLSFPGVQRRFTYRIKTAQRVLIDDYAHHPTEIDAVYNAVSEMYPDEKVTAIFQPHLYSRTRDFMSEFVQSLSQFDTLALLDIYPAREKPIEGITSQVLCEKIYNEQDADHKVMILEKDDVVEFIQNEASRVVLMIGAGDIGVEIIKVTEMLKDEEV